MRITVVCVALSLVSITGCGSDAGQTDGGGGAPEFGAGGDGSGGTGSHQGSPLDDPLFTTVTATVSEWITPEWYACATEESACALPCPSDDLWVAINQTDFRQSASCGACMLVSSPRGEVTVEVIENCAGACVDGEIELSRTAFERIGDPDEGHADVTWQLVPCVRTSPIEFSYEADSDEWWAGIQVRNTTLPVASLWIDLPEQGWTELERDGWNHFPVSANLGSGPFDFRIVAIDGQELLETDVEYVPGGVVTGKSQFES